MIILPPTATKSLPHKDLTACYFDGFSKELFIRGAIAWPEDGRPGFAILAGQEPATREVYPFEEFPFMTVELLAHPDGTVEQKGLAQFLMDVWAKYHCNCFYVHQHLDIHRRYSLQVYESKIVLPKPELIDVPIVDRLGDALIYEFAVTRKLHQDVRSTISTQLAAHLANPDARKEGMGVHALRCLLAGLEHAGWRQPRRAQVEKIHLLGRLSEMRAI